MRSVARWETDRFKGHKDGPFNWIDLRHDGEDYWIFTKSFSAMNLHPFKNDQEAIETEQVTVDDINAKWSPLGITLNRVPLEAPTPDRESMQLIARWVTEYDRTWLELRYDGSHYHSFSETIHASLEREASQDEAIALVQRLADAMNRGFWTSKGYTLRRVV